MAGRLPVAPGLTPTPQSTFEPAELAIILSHYEMGVIDSVQPFRGGSRAAPKLAIRSDKGAFLLKRRAKGRDDPVKVACAHQIQRHLQQLGFPLPKLILTARHHESLVQLDGRIYELFEFIKGDAYDSTPEAAADSGRTLAQLHRLLAGFVPNWTPPGGSYHKLPKIAETITSLPSRMKRPSLEILAEFLRVEYLSAGERVERAGFAQWPEQLIHGDWHPGNLLYKNSRVVGVFDYDTVRKQPRIIDIANGALQFSMTHAGLDDPGKWPAHVDADRFRAYFRGYDSTRECVVSRAEVDALPWLMMEALIVESVVPIATTGRFGVMDGEAFLRMVERKVRWLGANAMALVESIL
ncbi:MAG TPA: phosphotransferase [Phycisphaerales bacterium]|nr:phosphotransferase [Phycisphaerales bacterium]